MPPNGFVISQQNTYQLSIKNNETGNTITGTTSIVNDVTPDFPGPFNTTINWIQTVPVKVKWFTALGGKIYNLVIRIHYLEQSIPKYLDWSFGNVESLDTLGQLATVPEELEQDISRDEFYQYIATFLSPMPPGSRHFDSLDFIWTVGSQDLDTYIQVYQPSIGIVQEKPQFTNLTGGIGIFSSRNTYSLHGLGLSTVSLDALKNGPFTFNLGF